MNTLVKSTLKYWAAFWEPLRYETFKYKLYFSRVIILSSSYFGGIYSFLFLHGFIAYNLMSEWVIAKITSKEARLIIGISRNKLLHYHKSWSWNLNLFLYWCICLYFILQAVVNVIGMNKMTPPIKDLLPRLTPILKNRYSLIAHFDFAK